MTAFSTLIPSHSLAIGLTEALPLDNASLDPLDLFPLVVLGVVQPLCEGGHLILPPVGQLQDAAHTLFILWGGRRLVRRLWTKIQTFLLAAHYGLVKWCSK